MATFTGSDDLAGAEFVGADLTGARFVESDLSGVVMRGVEVARADIDAPWLVHGGFLRVNGVDVIPFVEAELDRRFPGRADRRAEDPEGLRAAWAELERTWAATLVRVAAMPAATVDISVAGEWSFAQTLRHLVLATDTWLGRGILEIEQPFHPLGLAGRRHRERRLGHLVFRRPPRRTPRCSRPARAGWRWCVSSSPRSRPTSWPRRARTRMTPSNRRPPVPACT